MGDSNLNLPQDIQKEQNESKINVTKENEGTIQTQQNNQLEILETGDIDLEMANWKKTILKNTEQSILNPKLLNPKLENDLPRTQGETLERNINNSTCDDSVFTISVRPKNDEDPTQVDGEEPPAAEAQDVKQKHLTAADVINLWKQPAPRTTSLTPSLTEPEAKGNARKAPQILACLAAATGQMSSGAVNGWSGGALTSISADPVIKVGTPQRALIVSCIGLGALVGCVCAGQVNNLIGRRTTLVLTAPLMLAGWLTLAFAQDISGVYLGRILCGIATGFLFTTCQVYSSEVPEPKLRGRLGTIPSLLLTVGVLLSYIAGGLLPWRQSCYVCALPSFFLLLFMLMVPESPYWLLLKGRRDEAMKALKWLRGPHYDVDVELKEMEIKIESVGRHTSVRELWHPRTRVPFIISLFMQTLQQVCGANILMMFTGSIFQASGASIDHGMATIYTGIGQLIVTIISVSLVDILGRRLLIVGATSMVGISTLALGGYFFARDVSHTAWPGWVPLFLMLSAVSGYCIGCRSVPWLLSAELFNTSIRSTANSVNVFYNRILNISMVQIFPFFQEAYGTHTVFFLHGTLSLVCCIITIIFVPETKGKSLEQIQEFFETKAKKKGASMEKYENTNKATPKKNKNAQKGFFANPDYNPDTRRKVEWILS